AGGSVGFVFRRRSAGGISVGGVHIGRLPGRAAVARDVDEAGIDRDRAIGIGRRDDEADRITAPAVVEIAALAFVAGGDVFVVHAAAIGRVGEKDVGPGVATVGAFEDLFIAVDVAAAEVNGADVRSRHL